MNFSVVIPVYNEKSAVVSCIRTLRRLYPVCEIVVSDGGSNDGTPDAASAEGVVVCSSGKARGIQLNRGAREAKGDFLIFLHVDTVLPADAFAVLETSFSRPQVKLATFRLNFDSDHWFLRLCGFMTRFDSVLTRFGDQCICIRRDFFNQMGGFPEWPLFEDVHFLRLARRRTRIYSLPSTVITSARRFHRKGIFRQQFLNGLLLLKYVLGVPPERLSREYK